MVPLVLGAFLGLLVWQFQVGTEPIKQPHAKPQVKHGLSESKRKEVFWMFFGAEDIADRHLYPTDSLTIGQSFILSEQTPLMPELEPADPMAAIPQIKQLPPGTRIIVINTVLKGGVPWYEVRALSSAGSPLGSGWINSMALKGQSSIDPQAEIQTVRKRIGEYHTGLVKRYGITDEELNQIVAEGVEKNWPTP